MSAPHGIEAVLFDGDQTLWDFQRVMREALACVAVFSSPGTRILRYGVTMAKSGSGLSVRPTSVPSTPVSPDMATPSV